MMLMLIQVQMMMFLLMLKMMVTVTVTVMTMVLLMLNMMVLVRDELLPPEAGPPGARVLGCRGALDPPRLCHRGALDPPMGSLQGTAAVVPGVGCPQLRRGPAT